MRTHELVSFLRDAIRAAAKYLGVKSLELYRATLWNIVGKWYVDWTMHRFWYGTPDLTLDMSAAIEFFIGEAWAEGLAQNGFTNPDEFEPEWAELLEGIIASEISYIPDFVGWMVVQAETAKTEGEFYSAVHARLETWIIRWTDARNQAIFESAKAKDKLEWVLGQAEHCKTCQALSGFVATSAEWEASGLHPQQPPNPLLECQGWNCKCTLVPTTKRKTYGALSRLLQIAMSGQV